MKIKLLLLLHIKITLGFIKVSRYDRYSNIRSEEFYDIYKLNVVSIPTNKLMLREDFNDQIFRTEKEKYNAITKDY